jgi:hypothetical protein
MQNMDEFREMWIAAADNRWSNAYAIVVAVGAITVFALSFEKRPIRRRVMTCLAVLLFTWFAMATCSLAINEKWRLRREWGERHASSVTEEQRTALITDGANIVVGPLLFAGCALLIFCGIGIGVPLIRGSFYSSKHSTEQFSSVTS